MSQSLRVIANVNGVIFDNSPCFVLRTEVLIQSTTADHVLMTVNRQASTNAQKTCGDKPHCFKSCTCIHNLLSDGFYTHTVILDISSVMRVSSVNPPPHKTVQRATNTCHDFCTMYRDHEARRLFNVNLLKCGGHFLSAYLPITIDSPQIYRFCLLSASI